MFDLVDPVTWKRLSLASVTILIALFLLLLLTRPGRRLYDRIEQAFSAFAERRILASCALFLYVILARIIVLPLLPVPTPSVHDEFSYLLMGDTFAHGRLTNPTHPMWMSFETFHVNWRPTYSSMYPPAQGFILALGQLLGHPWIGILLSNATMCVAIFWALQPWMPARWALLAAIIAALKFGLTSYWMNSYWGGAAASIGGALVFGGVGRIRKRVETWDALLLAIGVAILANSRPYEGLFVCLPAFFWLVHWLYRKIRSKQPWNFAVTTKLLPAVTLVALTAAFMGYYNWRLTGDAVLSPYVLNLRTYETSPLFLWQHFKPQLRYNNATFEIFYNDSERHLYQTDWYHVREVSTEKMLYFKKTYLWPGAEFLLIPLPFLFLDRKMKVFLITLAIGIAAIFAVIWSNSHYAAPFLCVFYGLLVQAVRHLRTMHSANLRFGLALSRVIVVLLVFDTAINICYRACDPLLFPCIGNPERAALAEKLDGLAGKHLVIVRYGQRHNPHREWVYNGADIDQSKVIWARDLGPSQNDKLLAYFKDRQVWLVAPDDDPEQITRYTLVAAH